MNRPIFFISSTIYDFCDLRSAIKYFLEEQGCKVLASEYNDFRKPLDVHSYQACLESIHQADYFILLVGFRVGGWYDKKNRISITQREYQEAYKLHLAGNLKVINFVRSDIWNLREDRTELEKYLDTLELDEEISHSITHHQTKKIADPEFIINFINEIGRNRDAKAALKGGGEFPTGNWLHVFSSFREIIDVLQPEVFDGAPIEEAVIKRLLLSELREIIRKCLSKFKKGAVYSPTLTIHGFYYEHEIGDEISEDHYTVVKTKRWDSLSTFSIWLLGVNINPLILKKSLSSSAFLKFNHENGAFEEEPVYSALHALHNEIQSLNKANTLETLEVVFEHTPRRRYREAEEIEIRTMELMALLHLLQRWSNVIEISKAIILYLEGNEFVMPEIFNKSPIPSMNEKLENEAVTQEELNDFINES